MPAVDCAVVLGVGPEQGLGAALSKRFAAQGLHVFLGGRSQHKLRLIADRIRDAGGDATPIPADATKEDETIRLFNTVDAGGYRLALAVYNVDSNMSASLLDTDVDSFSTLWRQNCLGGFLFGREAIGRMLPHKAGTLIFTGATASLRAKPPFTAFASAKAGLRALAQGMAREFAPQGIHVAHVVIDGVIDGERAEKAFKQLKDAKGKDGLLQLDAIADVYWALHRQHASAWTHELDLRPCKEPF